MSKKRFTQDFDEVRLAEREYLDKRRQENHLPKIDDAHPLWGLALSGGGVRSATFGLGLLQALIRKKRLARFDYMSTVSGGGYIGCCLTSLLTGRDDTGLDPKSSPFVGLRETQEDASPQDSKLSVRHQIHHLRTHGVYLFPRGRLLNRDVQRAVGSVVSGMSHTLAMFLLGLVALVATVHLVLNVLDPGLATLGDDSRLTVTGADELERLEYVWAVLKEWSSDRVAEPLRKVVAESRNHPSLLLWSSVAGALWALGWLIEATRRAGRLKPVEVFPDDKTRAGWTPQDQSESRFVWWFNSLSTVVAAGGALGLACIYRWREGEPQFLTAFAVPLFFSLGGLVASHLATHVAESYFARRSWRAHARFPESRFRRSLYGSVRGACLYGAAFSLAFPVCAVTLFSLSRFPLRFFLTLAALVCAYFLAGRNSSATTLRLGGWVRRPAANVAVLLFLGFAFAEVSAQLLGGYSEVTESTLWRWSCSTLLAALLAILVLGFFVDANRTAPHYFYRDRLTEAYLMTAARTRRPPKDKSQGSPKVVLRDDEDLKLHDVGDKNCRGPYHVIVAAVNLSGSDELTRKSFLSDHFEFGKYYVGSRATGFVRSEHYREGTTRLARAMTISAAAVGSAMGYHTFAAQAFVATLFNARLGYWMENPWQYRNGGSGGNHRRTFWPEYLVLEVLGLTSARKRLVNLSDGGHTGDNLGLLPLLRRRCSTILVSDAEADEGYSFESLNNAVRMAYIEENIRIEIDLTPIQSRKATVTGVMASEGGVCTGEIWYPGTGSEPEFKGQLIYVKSSLCSAGIPVHVSNYAKGHTCFPHETTADQCFDDAQFEAYRALGEFLGETAAKAL